MEQIIIFVLLGLAAVILLVLPAFSNKKKSKALNEMLSNVEEGDIIKTVGGVIGTVLSVKTISPAEKEMVVETGVGNNKTTMVFDIQAVYQVLVKKNPPKPPVDPNAKVDEKEETKAEKAEEQTEEVAQENVEESAVVEPAIEEKVAEAEKAEVVAEEKAEVSSEVVPKPVKKPATAKSTTSKTTTTKKSSK